jgi:hypothetical protein
MSSIYNISNQNPMTDKNIVFDIDETLVHTFDDYDKLKDLKIFTDAKNMKLRNRVYKLSLEDMFEKKGRGTETQMWGITRPHLKEFLIYCFTYFKNVGVWSAGQAPYVKAVVKDIFKDIQKPVAVFTWDDCSVNDDEGIYEKPLEKMYKVVPNMNETNTFILDDRTTSFSGCNNENGILIPAYKPNENISSLNSNDIAFQQLMFWLNKPEIMRSNDVRNLNKNYIFNTDI